VGAFPRFRASVALALVGVACTSANVSSPVTAPPPTTTPASVTSAPTSPPADRNPDVVTIRAAAGSLRVRGAYPHVASRCVHPTQSTLDARYPGSLTVRRAGDGTLELTVTLPFETYLEGIAEVPPTWPRAALEAQAIAARSYALSTTGWDGPEGATLRTPICSTTSCQVFRGIPVTPTPGIRRWYAAVDRTAGQVLEDGGRPIDAVYFSTSNGHTYPNEDVFGSAPLPYLRPVVERNDGASPTSHWRVPIPFDDLARFLRAGDLWSAGTPIGSVRLAGGSIIVTGGGASRTIDVSSFDAAVNDWAPCLMPFRYPTDSRYGSALPTTIPSHWYSLRDGANGIVVTGRGWGHGVGMVQWGAYGKARDGWSAARILAFYYGGLRPQPFAEPGLIHVRVADGLRSLTVVPSTKHATVDGRDVRGPIVIHGGDQLRVRDPISPAGSPAGPFTSSISRIGPELRRTLVGRNWHPGCPVPIGDLRLVRVSYHTFTGAVASGPLVVHERVARDVLWVFRQLYRAGFPIQRIGLPPRYRPPRPSDWYSRRDLSASYNCRPATGNPGSLSQHSYGWAIDINPLENPYVKDGRVLRRAAKPFLDRTQDVPGMIHPGDVVVRAFAAIGWEWGGDWHTLKDYMHFSLTGR
jgi:SpoIID/LytB domain protein